MPSKLEKQGLGQGRKSRVSATLDLLEQDHVNPLDVAVIDSRQVLEADRHGEDRRDDTPHKLLETYYEIKHAERLLRGVH